MFKVWMITDDEVYANRLIEYWKIHCGKELDVEIYNNIKETNGKEKATLIIADEEKKITYKDIEIVTLVSDIEKVKEPLFLSKYGKPQELYCKILTLCNNKKLIRREKVELIPALEGKENVLKLSMNKDSLDKYAIEILRNCPIEGLIPIQPEKNKDEVLYYIHGKMTLKEYMNNIESDRQLIQILKDVFEILIKVEDYMLNRNNLLLDTEHIYLHQITKQPALIYIPNTSVNNREWLERYQELLTQLSMTVVEESDTNNVVTIKVEEDKEESFVVHEALDCVDRTEFFQTMQKNLQRIDNKPKSRLYWKSKNKDIKIERKIFKIGKEKKFVDFCIDDNPAVSRNHADIVVIDRDVFIVDKNSLNHTYINGKQIPSNARVMLHDKDVITLADEEFIFYL